MTASGVRNAKGKLLTGDDGFDVGRVAIGQGGWEGEIQVTPLQMAQVAARGGQQGRADAAAPDRADRGQGRAGDRPDPAHAASRA